LTKRAQIESLWKNVLPSVILHRIGSQELNIQFLTFILLIFKNAEFLCLSRGITIYSDLREKKKLSRDLENKP